MSDFFILAMNNPMNLNNILNHSPSSSGGAPNPGPNGPNGGAGIVGLTSANSNSHDQSYDSSSQTQPAVVQPVVPASFFSSEEWRALAENIRTLTREELESRKSKGKISQRIYLGNLGSKLSKIEHAMLREYGRSTGKQWGNIQVNGSKINGEINIAGIENHS